MPLALGKKADRLPIWGPYTHLVQFISAVPFIELSNLKNDTQAKICCPLPALNLLEGMLILLYNAWTAPHCPILHNLVRWRWCYRYIFWKGWDQRCSPRTALALSIVPVWSQCGLYHLSINADGVEIWQWEVPLDWTAWRRIPMLMATKTVRRWPSGNPRKQDLRLNHISVYIRSDTLLKRWIL